VEVQVLHDPVHYQSPFPFFVCGEGVDPALAESFLTLFGSGEWQHRDEAFYRCFLRECTEEISAPFLRALAVRMAEVTGLPLTEQVSVTAQRLEPGQEIGVHSDRPRVGYELVRLVVALNPEWEPGDGGVLELFSCADKEAEFQVEPRFNCCFGFTLHPDSLHRVSRAVKPRKSVVFNFWHPANTPALAGHVQELMKGMHFSALPAALDAVAARAESQLTEADTFRASVAAWVLVQWGYGTEIITRGYEVAAELAPRSSVEVAHRGPVGLACWLALLYCDSFHLHAWVAFARSMEGEVAPEPLRELWSLCLPSWEEAGVVKAGQTPSH